MLFIIAISSIGMPLITHSCSHNNQKDIHLFSSEHHCEDDCKSNTNIENTLGFNEMPCCSFETSFLKSDNFFSSNNHLSSKHLIILYSLFLPKETIKQSQQEQIDSNFNHHKRYGYKYRIALQSFLC